MSNLILPKTPINNDIELYLKYDANKLSDGNSYINKTLSICLNKSKGLIGSKQPEWDKFKKYTNPYEYIHTNIPSTKYPICKLKPLSRSFYKMIELCKTMQLIEALPVDACKTFHFAEGPGGFIEAVVHLRNNLSDVYVGMTLINDQDHGVPGWNKSNLFLENNPSVIIDRGISKDGDILNAENLLDCLDRHNNSCDLVTADGGFDFTTNFNHQETVSLKLIFAQMAFALACQKKSGSFILKMFDTFTEASVDILYILSCVYEEVHFIKPYTSRLANSEKYIVCKNFRIADSKTLIIAMYNIIKEFRENLYPSRFLSCDIPYNFLVAIQENNAIFGLYQIECISQTLNLIEFSTEDRLDSIKKKHVIKCMQWCVKFNLPFNKINTNIFMPHVANK